MKTINGPTARASRLGHHHFAYLRAVAEGLQAHDIAQRYLGVIHGHEAVTAHRQVVDAVRAVARRSGEAAWRLVGLTIRAKPISSERPALEEFIDARDLHDWSAADVQDMYEQAYPQGLRSQRRQRLRVRQRDLLLKLEHLAAETPKPEDLIAGWFDDVTARKLLGAGMVNLGDLRDRIAAGGRWYRTLPGVGVSKAGRIAAHLATLIPQTAMLSQPVFTVFSLQVVPASSNLLDRATNGQVEGAAPSLAQSLLQADTDLEAVQAWVNARAGSTPTAKVYRREAHRLLLWMQHECRGHSHSHSQGRGQGTRLADMSVEDCRNYMAFLQHIPAKWISRTRAAPGTAGWAPFKGALSHPSQRQAIVIVAGLFSWLQQAQYLRVNPWVLVNTQTGDDPAGSVLDTKALSEAAYREVLGFVRRCPPSPSRHRIAFILEFVEAVGLRSAELIAARLKDISLQSEGYVMAVHGKGARNRVVVLPAQAMVALQAYLASRHLGGVEVAPGDAPLLASTLDAMAPVGYQALYETVKGWMARAVAASGLPAHERAKLAGASTHWLRHTFGTRAVAREVPLDVIQAQLGHASIQTTMSIYGRAPIKRRSDELGRAFG